MKKIKRLFIIILTVIIAFFVVSKIAEKIYPQGHKEYVIMYSEKYDVPKTLVYAMIKAESNFDKYAVSNKNASGLMQIMEPTGEWIAEKLGIADFEKGMLSDPETNIEMGCFYISYLLDMYDGNKKCALSAYNAGHANVDSWLLNEKYSHDGKTLDVIPYPETEKYVNIVMQNEKIYEYLYEER